MEKMCEWTWRPNGKHKQQDAFYYKPDEQFVYLARGGNQPFRYLSAPWLLKALSGKKYEDLHKNMQEAYNYLTARLGA